MLRNLLFIFILFILFSIPKTGYSGYRIVNVGGDAGVAGDFRTEVQAALPGDTVYIDVSDTVMLNFPVTINSNIVIQGPSPKHFILDATNLSGANNVFITNSLVNITINGIAMVNSATAIWFDLTSGESLTLKNCVFKNNSDMVINATGAAGQVRLLNCSFMSNTTVGGGTVSMMTGNIKVANCTFYNNQAPVGSVGAAIIFASSGSCELLHNTFYDNGTTNTVSAFYASLGSVIFQNNIFFNTVQNNNILQSVASNIDNGGNFINTSNPPISFSSSVNVIGSGQLNPLSALVVDGFGMEYFPLLAGANPCIDLGNPVPSLKYDARRVWRVMDAGPNSSKMADAGAVEYSPFTVNSTLTSGVGSFKQAVVDVGNLTYVGNKAIVFEHTGTGVFTTISNAVNSVSTSKLIINGFSQNGSITPGPVDNLGNATPGFTPVEFVGVSALDFLQFVGAADSCVVAGLSITNSNVAIKTIAKGTQIEGCHIGVNASGTIAVGNYIGVAMPVGTLGGSLIGTNNYIGFHPNNSRNVITGNTFRQIDINNSGGHVIQGNFIGSFSDGITAPLFATAPTTDGIVIFGTSATASNLIGGYGVYEGNLIAGQNIGVYNEMPNALITANFFGTEFNGYASISFAGKFKNDTGIELTSTNAYGGFIEYNVIGNAFNGISLENGANFNYVGENLIGLANDGVSPVAISGSGVQIFNANNNVIGGIDSLDGNFIANCNIGVYIFTNTSQISNDSIVGNFIGLDTLFQPAGNGTGISINSNIQNVFIGDTTFGLGNQIGFNNSAGISVSPNGTSGIRISGNSMYNNLGLGIDLDANAVTNIVAASAPLSNQNQIPPNILAIANCGANNYTTVKFEVDFLIGFTYQIEFFETDSDNQEGAIYLGTMAVNPVSQPDTFYMDLPSPASLSGGYLVATATKNVTLPLSYQTSEFSAPKIITASSATAVNASGSYCSDVPGGVTATIDLALDFNSVVNGGTANPVTWFTDPGLTAMIANPNSFLASSQMVYAGVSNGICMDTAVVTLTVNPSPDLTTFGISLIDETCAGSCDGLISYTTGPTGNGETYDFGFGPQLSNFAAGICAGTYTLTFVDANGCIGTDIYTINSPPVISVAPATGTDPLCNGGSGGAASITTPVGGTPIYNYQWYDVVGPTLLTGQTGQNATGLVAGTYYCEVIDGKGCLQNSGSVTLFDPTAVAGSISGITNITCFGSSDGTAAVIPSGGAGAYTFNWFDNITGFPIGQTTSTAAGLPASNYYCEVADANGCIGLSNIITISEPTAMTVSYGIDNQVLCFGANDGRTTVAGLGGTVAIDYTYNWIPAPGFGQGTNIGSSLAPGSYNVAITDDNGCVATSAAIVITEPLVLTVSYTQIDPTCFGSCNGQATANAFGGTPGYTYAWSSGGALPTDINLCAGTQNIIVTDLNGCTVAGGVALIDPPAVTAFAGPDTTLCQGDSVLMTGSATGGFGPYNFTWDNGVTDGTNTTPIVTTTYTLTALDNNGCTTTDAMIITIDAAPTSNAGLDVSVCANNADVTLAGAAINYISVSWLGGAGTYNPNNFTLNTVYTPTPAEITTGSLTLTLIADGVGACTASVTDVMVVTFTPPPTVNAGVDQTVCASNASVSLSSTSTSGGVIWTSTGGGTFTPSNTNPNPTYQTTPTAIAAGVDTLFLTTTGNGNCNAVTDTLIVTINPAPTVNAGADTTICSGGVANLNGSSTLAPSVSWTTSGDGSFSSTTTSISSYNPGPGDNAGSTISLYLSTTGPIGCISEIDSMVVTVLAPPSTSAITGPSSVCENATGVAYSVSPTVGSTYTWTLPPGASIASGVGTNSILVNFGNTSGSVDVIETNSTGCIGITVTYIITNNPLPIVTGNADASMCEGLFTVLTGGGAISYTWDNGVTDGVSFQPTAGITTFTVTGTDINGCQNTAATILTVNAKPTISNTFTNITCNGAANGTIAITAAGGTAPYQFSLDGGISYTANTSPAMFGGLVVGNYNLVVLDLNGCFSNTIPQAINEPAPLAVTSTSSTNVSCLGNDGTIDIIGASGGSPIYNYSIDGGASFQAASSFASLSSGTYFLVLQDQNLCTSNLGTIIVNAPIPITISTDFFTNITCNGLADGSITSFSATGGAGGFTYQWYNTITGLIGGQATLTATNLPPGNFYIEATDLLGCTQNSDTVLISEPAPIVLNVISTNPMCSNTNDGAISISVASGGTAPYTFSIDGGVTTVAGNQPFVFFNLIGNNTYTPNVTDVNGCSVSGLDVNLINPSPVVTTVVVTDISCFGSADGQFEVTMSGGTPTYTLSTDGGNTFTVPTANPEIINAAVGSFIINVVTMDTNGCTSDTMQYTVIEPAKITSTVTTIPDTCSQGIGQIIVSNVTGGVGPPYGYTIDGGTTIQVSNVFNVIPGTYNVVVGDLNNCIDANLSIVVSDISGTLTLAGTYPGDTICPGESAFVQAYGGASYNWLTAGVLNPLSDSSEVAPGISTLYVVEISSGNCMTVDSTEIIVSADGCALGEVSNNVFSPDGDGVNESFVLDIQYLLTNDNTVKIYNRWGDLINEFSNYNNVDVFWDGTSMDGTPVTEGTYFYTVEIPLINYSNSGWIQVVR